MTTTRTPNIMAAAFACALTSITTIAHAASGERAESAPRLILQITVDQLRGDLPNRYLRQMGDGGFRYLLEEGVVYADAPHAHANSEPIVGHTTLSTGAHPAAHGIMRNENTHLTFMVF